MVMFTSDWLRVTSLHGTNAGTSFEMAEAESAIADRWFHVFDSRNSPNQPTNTTLEKDLFQEALLPLIFGCKMPLFIRGDKHATGTEGARFQ